MLLWIALTALLAWGYRRRVREESIFSRGWAYYIGNTVIFAAAAGLSVAGMRGGMTRMTRPITLSNAMLYTADSGKANLILSNPFCILRTIGNAGSVKYRKYFTPEELPQRFTPVHQPADSAAVDLTGRNVMIFIMESMSAEHSAFLHPELYADLPEKGFTPFLDSLMRNGLTFKRMYANGSRSIQAMPSVLGSIPSFRTPFVLMPQSLGESRQLPAMLADKVEKSGAKVYLVNTGWNGTGKRMKLRYTRAMVTAALTGEIEKAEFVTDPTFGVQVPTSIEGVPSELLIPANTWEDQAAYEASCRKLAASFVENFKKYTRMSAEVVAAGPKA